MSLPAHLLNATATVFQEVDTPGVFGQSVQSLVKIGKTRCRADQKKTTRYTQPGNFEQTAGYFTVYIPDTWGYPIETKFWLQIVFDTGFTLVGQVDAIANPGVMAHHVEVDIIKRQPSLAIPV
jgi:hypothetical protein